MWSSRWRWIPVALGLLVSACGAEPVMPAAESPSPAAIVMVSGDGQDVEWGDWIGRPFVVRVTDARGEGAADWRVRWHVAAGSGVFETEAGLLPTATTLTDPDGLAEVRFRPTALGSTRVMAGLGGISGSPVTFETEATVTGARLARVAGNDQEGKAGESLDEPLVVRLTNARGQGVANVEVTWRLASGAGLLNWEGSGSDSASISTSTAPDGGARTALTPTALGATTVVASVDRLDVPAVLFAADATVLVIHNAYWGGVLGPGGSDPDVTVPAGTPVEWGNYYSTPVHVASTSAPPGGRSFDSGTLNENGRFRFVPKVAGVWEWRWEYLEYGEVTLGALTAR